MRAADAADRLFFRAWSLSQSASAGVGQDALEILTVLVRSIVISTSVCVSVCLSVCLYAKISLKSQARSLPIFFLRVASGRGSVILRQGDEIPRGRCSLGGFLPR